MTSRREFFGLLAAAPLVAPVVVKEMVAAEPPKALQNPKTATLQAELDWLRNCPKTASRERAIQSLNQSCIESQEATDRLYGAQINADGEAV